MANVVVTGFLLSPALLLPAINYHRCHEVDENMRQGLIASVNDTGKNLLTDYPGGRLHR
jgi:hypothetical protein